MPKTLADWIQAARERIQEIYPDELDEMIENHDQPLIIDVREADEFRRGHIPGALLIPRGVLEAAADSNCADRVETLCQAGRRTVVLYCDSGARSALAADTLTQMGYRAVNLAGGMVLWQAEGFPVITD